MDNRITRHDHSHKELPTATVDVVMINSRGAEHAWVKAARNSVQEQLYPVSLLMVDNTDHSLGIGEAYNLAVKRSNAQFIQFVGDDDLMMLDLIASEVHCLQVGKRSVPTLVHTTTNCMLLHDTSGQFHPAPFAHMGLFDRSWLLANPFNEALAKGIHIEVRERMHRLATLMGKPLSAPLLHHYGYVWRQHATMLSPLPTEPNPQMRPVR